MSTQVIICCGSGGVGKTTTSAALGLKWALSGQRVVVITIDPAKRLADSLGIASIGNIPTTVPIAGIDPETTGRLDAIMLDTAATFSTLIHRFAATPETAQQILENRYFQFASERLGGVHEYMAAEKVRQLVACGEYDTVVVDTPPTRNALDFLTAPDRMAELMDGAVMRWMSMPATKSGWRALELGSEAVAKVLRRLVGQSTIGEIAAFFELFRGLWDGFHARSMEVHRMLRSEHTRFYLVTSAAPAARTEALFFLKLLHEQDMPFGGFVVNRTHQAPAHPLVRRDLPSDGPLPLDEWNAVCEAVVRAHHDHARTAIACERSISALRAAGPQDAACWRVPDMGKGLNDLADLATLLEHLPAPRVLP